MDTIFLNFKKGETSISHKILRNLRDKINLKKRDSYTKRSYKNNKFKKFAPTWNDNFELPDGLCSTLDIQYHFQCIIKKQETTTNNSPITIYVNKIENTINFKIKTG